MGLWFSLIAGLVFSLVLWGVDGLGLSTANAYFPWAKMAMGIVPTIGIYLLAAWLSLKFDNGLITFIVWLLSGMLVSFLACHIPIEGITAFYSIFAPDLAERIQFVYTTGVAAHAFITISICAVISGVSGAMFNFLTDTASTSANRGGLIFPIFLWSLFFIAQGSIIDAELQSRLRAPIESINTLIDRRIASETVPVPKDEARRIHLYALNAVSDLVNINPRKLLITNYDNTVVQTEVQINFDGHWASCIVIADTASEPPVQQPVYCKKIE